MKTLFFAMSALAIGAFVDGSEAKASIVTFGSGPNTFRIQFVEIENPGNSGDSTGFPYAAGAVPYTYRMGKFEVSRDMVEKYNGNFGTSNGLAITLDDMSAYGGNGRDQPATGISWNEAARFVNWLNTSHGYQSA